MAAKNKSGVEKTVETLTHDEASRLNIPTAELSTVARKDDLTPIRVAYQRRDPDLDPQLIWRGKYGDEQSADDLVARAAPLYIQEKVHPKALIDDLKRESQVRAGEKSGERQLSLFADFNGLPAGVDKTEFYQHEQNWSNRMILGDSLQVMAGLAEREGLRGQVQCIYFDPPYGIKFNSNFQWSTTSRDVKDGKADHITREPEQVKAFRDTWRDGIHSYLSYIRDRLIVARDLLTDSGSIFVQIGDENVHRVRALMDEVFGDENIVSQIAFRTTTGRANERLAAASNYLIWAVRNASLCKYRPLFQDKSAGISTDQVYSLAKDMQGNTWRLNKEQKADISLLPNATRIFRSDNLTSSRPAGETDVRKFSYRNKSFSPGKGTFKTEYTGLTRLGKAERLWPTVHGTLQYVRFIDDFSVIPFSNIWTDTGTGSFTEDKIYIVQTNIKVIQRCLLMTTDPGDIVLDPTCGSGTTAYVAEQWGRRWITIDTSRVALALARARIMGARYPYYLLADSKEGQIKEAELAHTVPSSRQTYGDLRHGFVYERVPHITLKSIANNSEIDVIWDKRQEKLEPLREKLNSALKTKWEEWDIPREAQDSWPEAVKKTHADWWSARMARQKEIDASIAAKADFEFLYDKPYVDNKKVRVAGPFTVESLSPHRMLAVDENDDIIDPLNKAAKDGARDFVAMILEELRLAGVQQAHKEDKINFSAIKPWPGQGYICAEGVYQEQGENGEVDRRAAIFIGPEFGSLQRQDLVAAAREAADSDFDVLLCCAFNYDAHSAELPRLGRIPILKARMNADLHMSTDLKNTGQGNLFIIFGEPDIEILAAGERQIQVRVRGVDVFDPAKGEVRSDEPDTIACWFIDTDYNEESFFVRQAYFLGAGDPYKALKTSLKAEIDQAAWASLNRDTSRPFDKPASGRIAVKVINHLGDEVMKVYRVQ
ncbi:MAG: site-specific DNA-methyltransferase [Candidatus Adiutrix sp.]|jgi:adenine-specific DNA-methyltransferase|nr:site-specific DNA-methyltransferase [Candidatus Adiutrix sp.]